MHTLQHNKSDVYKVTFHDIPYFINVCVILENSAAEHEITLDCVIRMQYITNLVDQVGQTVASQRPQTPTNISHHTMYTCRTALAVWRLQSQWCIHCKQSHSCQTADWSSGLTSLASVQMAAGG